MIFRSPAVPAIREGRWKALVNLDRSRVELYDIPSDPTELSNVAKEHPDITRRLAGEVIEWQKTIHEGPIDANAGFNSYPGPKPVMNRPHEA